MFASLDGLTDDEKNVRVVGDVFTRIDARDAFPGVLAAAEAHRPDVIVRELAELAGDLVAERIGVPCVAVGISMVASEEAVVPAMVAGLSDVRAELGLPADPDGARLVGSPYLTLAPPSLDGVAPRELRRFREPGLDGVPRPLPDFWPGDDRPLVYLTLGSVAPQMAYFPEVYRAAIDALAALDVRVLVTVGHDRDPRELGSVPPSVRVERWVPQSYVMPHVAAIAHHGGFGTTRTALAAGVPAAVLPLFADQPINAAHVQALGAGLAVGRAEDLGPAVERLLEDDAYRRASARVADEVRALPPIDEAPGLVRELTYSQPRSVAWSTAWARSTAPSLP